MRVLNGRKSTNPKSSERSYWFGYNGMEKDPEIKGEGNSYTTEFRQYDPRLGRWLSLDPLMSQFPWMSPYVAFDNNPIFFVDPLGLAAEGGDDPKTHELKKGENLSILAKKYNVSIEQLQTWNPGTKGRETKLQIGEKIIVSDPSSSGSGTAETKQAEDLWTKEEYEERLENPAINTMAIGISTAANSEWGGVGATMDTDMSEEEKQDVFKEDGLKTVCILLMEFHQGIGHRTRVFHESEGDKITEDVKWSAQTYLALEYLEKKWMEGKVQLGQSVPFKSETSPGQVGIGTSIWAHGNQFFHNRTSFYLGGMEYTMWIYQGMIVFKVVNDFTISSGVTKDDGKSNLIRVIGETCPLGNTKQVFWFTHSLPTGPPIR
ncbi:MAG: LysM peptidoglycan-binding domain-containing protein [Flavobacteriia bacterium]|nr:LysM peptidoglycan-binding domain-containing protein [Flavobacteriia bacterium]